MARVRGCLRLWFDSGADSATVIFEGADVRGGWGRFSTFGVECRWSSGGGSLSCRWTLLLFVRLDGRPTVLPACDTRSDGTIASLQNL